MIGDRLYQGRKRNSYTLKQLASKTELSVSYISDLEHGRTDPSLKTIRKLAVALDVSVAWLTTGECVASDDLQEMIDDSIARFEFEHMAAQAATELAIAETQIKMSNRPYYESSDITQLWLRYFQEIMTGIRRIAETDE